MSNKYKYILFFFITCFITTSLLSAKDNVSLALKIMGGITYKTESLFSGDTEYSGTGAPIGVSLLLEPDHSLSIGIEAALIRISSYNKKSIKTLYGVTNTSVVYRTVPLLMTAVLTKKGFNFIAGFGTYYSYVIFESNKVTESHYSDDWDMGFMLGVAYDLSILESLSLGAMIKYYNIPEREVNLISPQIYIKYNLFDL